MECLKSDGKEASVERELLKIPRKEGTLCSGIVS